MRLYLAEKRQQGETIARFLDPGARPKGAWAELSGGDIVTWCRGHLYELAEPGDYDPAWKDWSADALPMIPQRWKLVPREGPQSQRQAVNRLLSKCDEVVLCTDFDREGQYLGMNALYEAGFSDLSRVFRAKLTALDAASLKRAFSSIEPVEKSMPLYWSALARSHSDWLVGLNLTRLYTCMGRAAGVSGVVNLGRVITPAAALVARRDAQIALFKPKDYYEIKADLIVQHGRFTAKWQPPRELQDGDGLVTDTRAAQEALSRIRAESFSVSGVEAKRQAENPPLPFTLAELQAWCASRLGFQPSRTLKIAQELYDRRIASYPRTDCAYIPEAQHAEARAILQALASDPKFAGIVAGCDPGIKSRAFSDRKFQGHAHNAIIPTTEAAGAADLDSDCMAVFDIIRRRYCAQFYAPAQWDCVKVSLLAGGESFSASGRTLAVPGYRVIFAPGALDEAEGGKPAPAQQRIPPVSQGEAAAPEDVRIEPRKTRPPKHFTLASLTRAMEGVGSALAEGGGAKASPEIMAFLKDHGIGTAATRAGIIDNLFKYGWCVKEGGNVIATRRAHEILAALPDAVKSPETTAAWEDSLDRISSMAPSEAERGAAEFEARIAQAVTALIGRCRGPEAAAFIASHLAKAAGGESAADGRPAPKCPGCGQPLRKFKGKSGGMFWGCRQCGTTYQDWKGAPLIPPSGPSAPKCPRCGSPLKPVKSRKGGLWWICQGPGGGKEGCGYVAADAGGRPSPAFKCPKCGKLLRRCRRKDGSGWFWTCGEHFFEDLQGAPVLDPPRCPDCGRPMRLCTRGKDGKPVAPYFWCTGWKEGCHCRVDKYGKRIEGVSGRRARARGHKEGVAE